MPRFKLLSVVALTGLLSTGMALSALAQPPGPPPGPGGPDGPGRGPGHHGPRHGGPGGPERGGPGMLLRSEEVQAELGISEEQQEQLKELGREMREKMRGQRGERRARPPQGKQPGEGRKPDGELREKREAAQAEVKERLAEVLDQDQMKRLEQIHLQMRLRHGGPGSFARGQVGDELEITDDQKEQLRERAKELREEAREKMEAMRAEGRERMEAMRAEGREKLLEVLSTAQRAEFEEMVGEPFYLPPPPREHRGPRHHGPRRGGPPRGGPPRDGGPERPF